MRIAIAPRTVERHIDNARLKMRARNRTHLVTRAIASGLLDAPARDDKDAPLSAPFIGQAHGGVESILLL